MPLMKVYILCTRPFSAIILAGMLTTVLLVCSSKATEDQLPKREPDIRGVITRSDTSAKQVVILIEEHPSDTAGSAKARVRLTEGTKLWSGDAEGLRRVGVEELTVGRTVRAWFDGPVAESYPVQATAGVVVLEAQ